MSPTSAETAGFTTIAGLMRAARQRLAPAMWDHAAGGVATETTIRRNRQAMESLAFRPRLLRGVGVPDITTTLLGMRLDSPIVFAPVGTTALFSPQGALAPASVAAERNGVAFSSAMASPTALISVAEMMEVGAAAHGRAALQFYVRGDRDWQLEFLHTAERAGFFGVCLTADSIGGGVRDRDLLNNYHDYARALRPNLPASDESGLRYQLSFTWDDLSWLQSVTDLPVIVKGITTPEDASEAVSRGARVLYVSNHGGRALDGLPATLEVLPEVVAAVDGRAEVIVDGGFLRGTDIVKGLALGANAVAIGKLQLWALSVGGDGGLNCVLNILEQEVRETLQLLGAASVADLGPHLLRGSTPTRYAVTDLNQFEWAPMPRL